MDTLVLRVVTVVGDGHRGPFLAYPETPNPSSLYGSQCDVRSTVEGLGRGSFPRTRLPVVGPLGGCWGFVEGYRSVRPEEETNLVFCDPSRGN